LGWVSFGFSWGDAALKGQTKTTTTNNL